MKKLLVKEVERYGWDTKKKMPNLKGWYTDKPEDITDTPFKSGLKTLLAIPLPSKTRDSGILKIIDEVAKVHAEEVKKFESTCQCGDCAKKRKKLDSVKEVEGWDKKPSTIAEAIDNLYNNVVDPKKMGKQFFKIAIEDLISQSVESARREGRQERELYKLGVKEERQRVVEMIEASRKTMLGYDPLPGSEYDKINVVLDKLISDLQSKLESK